MAIIYTYNTVIPEANDILLGTEKNATLRNPTKNFNIGEIAKFIIDSVNGTTLTLPLFFDVADPITGLVQTTLVDSIMTQDVNPNGTILTVAGNFRATGAIQDSTASPGTVGQVLTSTVTGTAWGSVSGSTEVIPFNNIAVVTANHTGALGTFDLSAEQDFFTVEFNYWDVCVCGTCTFSFCLRRPSLRSCRGSFDCKNRGKHLWRTLENWISFM